MSPGGRGTPTRRSPDASPGRYQVPQAVTLLVAVAAVTVALSACAQATPGGVGAQGSATAVPITSVPPLQALPARPREIDLGGVNTCTLLTSEQQQQIGTDVSPGFSKDPDSYGNKRCHYSKALSSPYFDYSVKVVTQEDATVYLTSARDAVARVVTVAGFPAVEARPPGDERGCFVLVSTKDGQYLSVQYGLSTGSVDTPEMVCAKARAAAGMAMQTLFTQR